MSNGKIHELYSMTLLQNNEKKGQDNLSFDIQVLLYTKKDCSLCDVAKDTILRVQREIPFDFKEMDIKSRKSLYEKFKYEIPIVFINGQRVFTYRVNGKKLKGMLVRLRQSRAGKHS